MVLPAGPHWVDTPVGRDGRVRRAATDAVRSRVPLVRAIADWHDAGLQGLRRDFALRAAGATKSIAAAEWRWLEASFDLARLGIERFSPMLWLAGDASLRWEQSGVDVGAMEFVGIPLQSIGRTSALHGDVRRYWLIENRASFERQARSIPEGIVMLWMPGRPSAPWLRAVAHLLALHRHRPGSARTPTRQGWRSPAAQAQSGRNAVRHGSRIAWV